MGERITKERVIIAIIQELGACKIVYCLEFVCVLFVCSSCAHRISVKLSVGGQNTCCTDDSNQILVTNSKNNKQMKHRIVAIS